MIYNASLYKTKSIYKGNGIYKDDAMSVTIGGKTYPIVKIGEQVWLAKNLDFVDSNIVVGANSVSDSSAQANYYNNQDSYEKYGRLYNWLAVKYINDNSSTICPGWRVPTDTEYAQLLAFVGSVNTAKKLRSEEWDGTDDYSFGLLASGQFTNSGFSNNTLSTSLWTITSSSDSVARRLNSYDSTIELGYSSKPSQFPIRLIKE